MKQPSIVRHLLLTSLGAGICTLALVAGIVYFTNIQPTRALAKQEALTLAEQNIQLRLQAKLDAVTAIATGLARDPAIRAGLQAQSHRLMYAPLANLTEDFSQLTDYRSVHAQVIDHQGIIRARSWDVTYAGSPAPHPLVQTTLQTGKAQATFGIGNAGVGMIGFAPILHEGQVLGVISVTQGVGSVVRDLREAGYEWTLLLSKTALLNRFGGQIPPVYQNTTVTFNDDYLLAHHDWFSQSAADWILARYSLAPSVEPRLSRFGDQLLLELPIEDSLGTSIGRSLLVTSSTAVDQHLQTSLSAVFNTLILTGLTLLAVLGLVIWLLRQHLVQPLLKMTQAMQGMVSSGHFSQPLSVARDDELGRLTQGFNQLAGQLNQMITEATQVMTGLAEGHLDARIHGDYLGDLDALKQGINRAAEKLEKSHHEAQQASKAKSRFLANMSHEIRTPINGVIGMLSLLEDSSLTSEQRTQLQLAQSSAELLLGLVNDVLDFSKIEAGKMTLESQPIPLREIIEGLQATFQHQAHKKGLKLTVHYAQDVSPWVVGDSLRLRQVLNNLLSNALKFTQRGYVQLEVKLQEKQLCLAVKDSGIGISETEKNKLFQSFSQADTSTSRQYGGTGLGLKISAELVRLMAGEIGMDSTPAQGSSFWFKIPYQPCDPVEHREASMITWRQYSDKKILVVEDNHINQQLAIKLLEKFGVHPVLANNGEDALKAVAQQAFDLILMDCQMPIMDGYEATRQLRLKHFCQPIIALTANVSTEDRQACIAAGMDEVLTKPYTLAALSDLLERRLH